MNEKTYTAVYFDVDLPALPNEARQLRLGKAQFVHLLNEALPGKVVELNDRYGVVGEYKVISSRMFKTGDDTFLIFDIKTLQKISDLQQWLNKQVELQCINPLFYRFMYEGVLCVGKVTVAPDHEILEIRANLITHDIGHGAGAPVYKTFKRLL